MSGDVKAAEGCRTLGRCRVRENFRRIRVGLCPLVVSNAALFRWPDDFVLLNLETHGQGVGDDFFNQFHTRNRCLSGGNRFENFVLLLRRERMHPRKEQRADGVQLVRGNLLLGPVVIFLRADDELDLVGRFQVRNISKAVAGNFAAGGAFQIHDAMDAGINLRNVVCAAGFDEHGETRFAKLLHEREGIFLKQRFSAGELDKRKFWIRLRQFFNFGQNFIERFLFAFGEGVGGIAERTAQVAAGEADENARQPGKGAFTLQAQVDFVDDERCGHAGKIDGIDGIQQDFPMRGWKFGRDELWLAQSES